MVKAFYIESDVIDGYFTEECLYYIDVVMGAEIEVEKEVLIEAEKVQDLTDLDAFYSEHYDKRGLPVE